MLYFSSHVNQNRVSTRGAAVSSKFASVWRHSTVISFYAFCCIYEIQQLRTFHRILCRILCVYHCSSQAIQTHTKSTVIFPSLPSCTSASALCSWASYMINNLLRNTICMWHMRTYFLSHKPLICRSLLAQRFSCQLHRAKSKGHCECAAPQQ